MTTYRKQIIEVALPLEAINKESARKKSIRHGHRSTLHLWWARRQLAACRAVLFSSLVNDPDDDPEPKPSPPRKTPKPHLIELMAAAAGFSKDGTDRFFHADGGWIQKSSGNTFPWEQYSADGTLVQSYWVKDCCIERESLQLDAAIGTINSAATSSFGSILIASKSTAPADSRPKSTPATSCTDSRRGIAVSLRYLPDVDWWNARARAVNVAERNGILGLIRHGIKLRTQGASYDPL